MSSKRYLIIAGIIIVILAGVWAMQSRRPQSPTSTPTPTPSTTTATSVSLSTPNTTHEVIFNGDSYSPATLTVKKGETVHFKNVSSKNTWIASNNHPFHTIYRELDANKGYKPDETYSFTFDRVGTWGYHDHLNSRITGTIIVTQ